MTGPVIINFKESKQLKEAIRRAAFHGGFKNSSQFLSHIVKTNRLVINEMSKIKKKVA